MFRRDAFTIHRLTTTGTKKEYTATAQQIVGQLDTVGGEFVSIADGSFGRVMTLTSPQTEVDIRVGDRLVSGGTKYEVKGVQKNARLVPNTVVQIVEAQS